MKNLLRNIIVLLFLVISLNAFPTTRFFDTWTTDDPNQDLTLTPTGTGAVRTSNDIEMRFYDSLGAFIGLKASGVTADQTYVLPPTDGNANDQLSTDGAGNMAWVAPLTVPSGTQGSVIFLNALGGLDEDPANFFWDNTLNKLSLGTDTAIGKLTLVGAGSTNSMLDIYAYAGNPNFHSTVRMRRANGSEASPSRTQVNEDIGSIEFDAHNGTVFVQSTAIEVSSVEDFSGVKGSTKMEFFVSPSGPIYKQLALTINPDQTADFTASVGVPQIIVSSTSEGSKPCPSMTEIQRDAIGAPTASDCIFNSDAGKWNTYNGTSWGEAGGGDLNTGLKTGGDLAIGAPTTTFSISDGSGVVVDSHTNPDVPVITDVAWTGLTNIVVTSLAANFTSIGIDSAGSVIQKPDAFFTLEERRDTILLGALITISHVAVDSVAEAAQLAFGGLHNLYDFGLAVGPVSSGGNVYSGNGVNLNVDRTAGSTFSFGSNYSTSKKSPNVISQASAAALSFNYTYQDGIGGYTVDASTALIDPTKWDDGTGVLNTVNANNWSIKRIYFLPHTGATFIHHGQEEYGNFNQAVDGLSTELFIVNPDLARALLRSFLLVRGGATDLTSTADAVFVEADKFGQSALGGVGAVSLDLQAAYDNSTQPQIVLDATRNGVEIRDNSTPIGVSLFAVQDNAGTTDFFDVTAARTTLSPIVDIDGDANLLAEGELRFQDAAGGEFTGFKAPTTLSGSQVYTLPDGDGSAGQALKTDGAGTLDWGEASVATTDLIYVEKFNGKSAPFSMTSGNNGTFDNGGVLSGGIAAETAAPLSPDTSFKYTQAGGSLSDWIKSEAITTNLREQTNSVWVSFWYTYNGANDDIQIIGYDNTNSVVVSSQIALIQNVADSTYIEFQLPVANNTTSISWGIHTKVLNSGKILLIDDVEISIKNKVKNETIRQTLTYGEAGSSMLNRTQQARFSTGLSQSDFKGPIILKKVDNAGAGRTDFECILANCYITANAFGLSDAGDLIEFQIDGVSDGKGSEVPTGNWLGGSFDGHLVAGQSFSVGVRNSTIKSTIGFTVNIIATASSPNTVTSTDVPITYMESDGDFTVTGTNFTATDVFAQYYIDGNGNHKLNYTIEGAATSAAVTTITLTMSGVTFSSVIDQPLTARVGAGGATYAVARANKGTGAMLVSHASLSNITYLVSGDVYLDSKPTWAANVSGQVGLKIPADQFQTKYLVSTFTTDAATIADLGFANLKIGKCYSYILHSRVSIDSTDAQFELLIDNAGTAIGKVVYGNANGGADEVRTKTFTNKFIATGTTVDVDTSSLAVGTLVVGSNSIDNTWAQLTEKANCIETTKF